ncbi:MAG TPA: hypothetical protein VHK27_01940 [Gammaproteobacteria bacterium]|nr:hypothetical protein [Gammaproteobacteria bacterium]
MNYEIYECSEAARRRIEPNAVECGQTYPNTHHRAKYPFSELKLGQAFAVPFKEASEPSLRVTASRLSKELKRKFIVIKHNDWEVFEVARIA